MWRSRRASPMRDSRRRLSPHEQYWFTELRCLLHLGHRVVHAVFHLVGRHVFDVSRNRPFVAKGVSELAITIAPELIRNGHFNLCSGFYRAIESSIDVLNIDVQAHGRAADGLRRESAELWIFVAQHDQRISDLHLSMHHFSVGSLRNSSLLSSECLLVELDCSFCVAHGEKRSERVIALGNGFYGHTGLHRRDFPSSLHRDF